MADKEAEAEEEQPVHPLACTSCHTGRDEEAAAAAASQRRSKLKNRLKFYSYIVALTALETGLILVFALTILKFRTPKFRVWSANLNTLSVGNTTNPSFIVTLKAEFSVKNTNFGHYPKGFRSRVKFFNVLNPTEMSSYISEILDAGFLGPLFKVTLEDSPNESFTDVSAQKCWEMVMHRLNQEITMLQSLGKVFPPLRFPQGINGLEMFGFQSPSIIQAIEALDPDHHFSEYWNNKFLMEEFINNSHEQTVT